MNFILTSLIAYIFNAGATIIDKILLEKSIPNPIVYVFYINILGFLAIFLIPFGVQFEFDAIFLSLVSGWSFVFGVYFYFKALKDGEASVVSPIVGSLNPLFTLLLGSIFLQQVLTTSQHLAFFIIFLGTVILTFNLWFSKVKLNEQLTSLVLSGLGFAISYLALREAYLLSNFMTGLTFNRLGGAFLVLAFLLIPTLRNQILISRKSNTRSKPKLTFALLGIGQLMGGLSGLLINYSISLANPALVNSLFGAQYLVILVAAIFLHKKNPHLLEERISGPVLVQKIIGAIILSIGVYLLTI